MDLRSSVIYLLSTLAFSQGYPLNASQQFFELIKDLNSTCAENPLLTNLNSELTQCKESDFTKIDKDALMCLSFFDINRRLCENNNLAVFNLKERLINEQSMNISIEMVCAPDSGITFEAIPKFPQYIDTIKSVFVQGEICSKFCINNNKNTFDIQPNYFCKVLYYGASIMKDIQNTIDKHNAPVKPLASDYPDQSNGSKDIVKSELLQKLEPENVKLNSSIIETIRNKTRDFNSKTASQSPANSLNSIEELKIPAIQISPKMPLEQTNTAKTSAPLISKSISTITTMATVGEKKEIAPASPQENANGQDNEYGTEIENGLDIGGDDGNYDMGKSPASAKKVEQPNYTNNPSGIKDESGLAKDIGDAHDDTGKYPQPEKTLEHFSISNYASEAETIDDPLEDEEGGFFPFFFFGIAMMVLIYILYHNKNKIMGLLIEGRHSGTRRRTSRGHAYRKLDTLEQAMSTHEARVTPSKIIY